MSGGVLQMPSRPSIRALVTRLEAWGAERTGRQHGDFEMWKLPDGERIEMPRIGTKRRVSKITLGKILAALGVGPSEFWWGYPGAPDRIVPGMTEDGADAGDIIVQVHDYQEPAAPAAEREEPEVPDTQERTRGIAARVLDVLSETRAAMSLDALNERLPHYTRQQLAGAANYLIDLGYVNRLMDGVYVLTADMLGERVPPSREVTLAERPTPPAQVTVPTETDLEAEIGSVLDLLFPDGFHGQHLPAINRWQAATAALIKEVRGG